MKLTGKFIIFASTSLLLVAFVVRSATLGTPVLAQSVVGVEVDDWVKYESWATFSSDDPNMQMPSELIEMNETEWVKNVVVDNSGGKVTFERVFHYSNNTETKNVEYIDLDTGESSSDGLFMFIPSNLEKNDLVYSTLEDYWVNETVRRTYLGVPRDVNHLNVSSYVVTGSQVTVFYANYYWDKATGILCERPGTIVIYDGDYTTRFTILEMIIDSNLWASDTESPVADAGQDLTVNEDQSVSFDASYSYDNMGIVIYQWDFGDGGAGNGVIATHSYTDPGTYTVSLTVWDAAGNSASDTITVDVEKAESSFPIHTVFIILVMIALIGVFVWMWNKPKQRPKRRPKRRH